MHDVPYEYGRLVLVCLITVQSESRDQLHVLADTATRILLRLYEFDVTLSSATSDLDQRDVWALPSQNEHAIVGFFEIVCSIDGPLVKWRSFDLRSVLKAPHCASCFSESDGDQSSIGL